MKLRITGFVVLLALYAQFGYSQNETTQESEKDTVLLDDVIIQENRLKIPFSESNRSTEIVLAERLKEQPLHSLAEALSGVAGVDVRSRGVAGMQADLSIRGSTFDENLIMLNGVKMSDPQTGHHLMNLPVNFQDIEKIEVLKGATARIYGQNAYSGAINVVTKLPETPQVFFSAYGGIGPDDSREIDSVTYHSSGVSIGVAVPSKIYNQYFSYGNNKSNGHRYNSDYEINNLYYHSSLKLGENQLSFQAGYSWRNFGANGFYAGNEEFEKVKTGVFSLDFEGGKDRFYHNYRVYWRVNKDNYKYNRYHPEYYQNIHLTNSMGLESNFSYRSSLGYTGFGFEVRYENIRGINEGRAASNPLLDDDQRTNVGLYFEHRYENGRFSMTPGVYINDQSEYGISAFPGVDIGYDFTSNLKVYANVGRTYRVPTFYDLHYYSDATQTYGNPDLKPGVANNYEVGMKANSHNFFAEVAGFYVDSKTSIDWVYDPDSPDVRWKAMNFDNVNKYGFEASFIFNLDETDIPLLRWLEVNYTYIKSDLQDDNYKSLYATSNLKHQLNLSLTHKIAGSLFNSVSARYRSRPDVTNDEIQSGIKRYDSYVLLDTKVFYQLKIGQIFIEGTNLLNTKYVEVGNVEMPGRWFRAGVVLNFPY